MAALRRMCTMSVRCWKSTQKVPFTPTINANNTSCSWKIRYFSRSLYRFTIKNDIHSELPGAAAGTDVGQPAVGGQSPGSDSAGEPTKSRWSRWTGKNIWKVTLALLSLSGASLGAVLLYEWGKPKVDESGKPIEDEFTHLPLWKQYIRRAFQSAQFFKQMIQDPTSAKLLPDPLREPYYQPPYTLVLEMTGVLIHPDWTLSTGWRFKKRPGLEYFLQQVGPPLFEIVIYTSEQGFTAYPLLNAMDPKGYIMYRLFRDSTRYIDGHHVKDLNCLNRDLSKVIMIDHDKQSYKLNPRSGLAMKKWNGQDDDKALYDLANFLRTLASSGVEDVRTVIDYYNQFDDPIEAFRQNQARLQEEQERSAKQQEEEKRSGLGGVASSLGGWLGSFLKR